MSDISLARKRSSCLFIFGAGPSLRELTAAQIEELNKSDCFAFNSSVFFRGIDWDFYLVREFINGTMNILGMKIPYFINRDFHKALAEGMKSGRCKDTQFFINIDWKCGAAQHFEGKYLSRRQSKLYYTNKIDRRVEWPPAETLSKVPHGSASLIDVINIGYIMGYNHIALVGIDLNDYTHFDAPQGREEIPNATAVPHRTRDIVLPQLAKWRDFLESKGIKLEVVNPQSAAASVLDVFEFDNIDKKEGKG